MVDFYRRQVLNLLLGDIEQDAVIGVTDTANRDSHLFAAPQMTFLEKHVGYLVIPRVDDQPLDTPDLPVRGMDLLASSYSHLA
jgi:hypothetical protein